jgi:hypothetical protein
VLDRFKKDVTSFKYTWKRFAAEWDGFKIRASLIKKFFKDLQGDLGMAKEKSETTIDREIV